MKHTDKGTGDMKPPAMEPGAGCPKGVRAGCGNGITGVLSTSFNVPFLLTIERKKARPDSGQGWVQCPLRWRPALGHLLALGSGAALVYKLGVLEAGTFPPSTSTGLHR